MTPTQILALILSGARINQVGAATVFPEGVGFGAGKIRAVAATEFVGVAVVGGKQEMAATEGLAPDRVDPLLLATAIEWDRNIGVEFDSIGVRLGHNVDNTRDRIRSVNRRRTGLEYLDAARNCCRKNIEVER